ncbi:MAG TPA: two-component regulator propeller domain-containing protein, partial [Gemmatimonadaceae bacterium]|nr:two-component regulator propeller domain-containing protein [Gemmatimonadaceae bacterium]
MNTPIAPPRPAAGRHFRLGAAGVLALLLSTLPAGARAQSQPRLAFERIAQERGLSNGTVTAIVQGRAGFLWIGTEDGLNRYDGSGFILYRPMAGDTTSLADAWVTAIAPSRTGTPWVATLRGGVHRLLPRSTGFLRYRHTPGDSTSLSSNQVNAVLEARDGALWAGTVRGLDRLDPATGRVRRYAPVPGDSGDLANDVLSLAEEPSGALWVGTRQGLFAFDPARGRFDRVELALRTRVVRTLLRDRRGSLWVGTEDELVALDAAMRALRARWRESAPARHVPFSGRVMALHEGPDGTIWIGSDGGLAALDPATGTFARHRYDPRDPRSLGGKIVRSVLVDRGGVLWAGLESYGLSKHAPAVVRFDVIRHDPASPSSLSDGYIRGITEDRRGNLWIGTQFGGLDRRDARTGRITAYRHRPGDPRSLPGDEVWAVLEDRAGTMWVGLHQRGLGTFDPRTGTFARSPLVPDDASVNLVYEDRAGTLLVGLEGRGLIELSPDRRSARRYGATTGERRVLAHDDVQAILEDREGMLWVGGAGGLTRLDRRTGCATQFRGAPGRPGALAADFITNIVEDRAGTLWVATKGGGLSRFDRRTERFTTFGVADGLPHSFVYGVLEDARGNLWLSTDDGIAMLDPRTRLVTRYTLADGLQAREFNRRAFHRGRDGTMYFGGIAGVNVFRPDEAADAPPPPPVSLVSLRVGDAPAQLAVSLTPDSVVRLRHDQNAFALSFAALDFTAPEKSEFAYRLEGADRAWVRAGTRRDAAYAGVPPGRYVFRVTAASAAGVWNPASAGVTIEIAPPWWGTWWARVLAGLLLVGIPIAAIRARLRAVRRRSALLERMVDEQTRGLTETQARLREALEREREAARELLDITATMPGAVFQLREAPDGGRTLPFVSEGIVEICRDGALAPDDGEDPRQLAEWLLTRIFPEELESARRARAASRDAMAPWEAQLRWSPADGGEPRWLAVRARPSRHLDGAT